MARATSARSGDHRNSWPTRCVTPARCGRVEHLLGLGRVERERLLAHAHDGPRAHASIASGACVSGGVAIVTASTPVELERVGERRARVRDPEPFGAARGAVGVAAHQRVHGEAGVAQRGNMNAAPEAGSDDDRARH